MITVEPSQPRLEARRIREGATCTIMAGLRSAPMFHQEDLVIMCYTMMSEEITKSLENIKVVRDFCDVF